MPAQDVYTRLLPLSAGRRGYPLWTPEPSNELLIQRREGLAIGDVGVVLDDGGFDVLFNICLPPNHPFHLRHGVPQGFNCIHPSKLDIRTIVDAEAPGHVISSSSITRETFGSSSSVGNASTLFSYRFSLSSDQGALLILPKGAEQRDLLNKGLFLEQARQHAAEWYNYAVNRRQRIINPDSLYFITGFHKTCAWSVAAFENATGNNHIAHFREMEGNDHPQTYSWETTTCAFEPRVVPNIGPHIEYGIPNQTVFIRGFKIAIRSGYFGTRWVCVEADAPPAQLSSIMTSTSVVRNPSVLGGLAGFMGVFPSGGSAHGPTTTRSEGTIDTNEQGPQSNLSSRRYDFEIQQVPDAPPLFHPSDAINNYLLNKDPSAYIAITHDSHWISIFEDGSLTLEELWRESSLETLLSQNDIVSREGVVYLEIKPMDSQSLFTPERQASTTAFPQTPSSSPHLSTEDTDIPFKQDVEETSVPELDDNFDGGFDHFFSYPFSLPTLESHDHSIQGPSEGTSAAPYIESGGPLNTGGSGLEGHPNIDSIKSMVHDPELKEYVCNWIINGQPCGSSILGRDLAAHLCDVHHVPRVAGLRCRWDDCGTIVPWSSLCRHIKEAHLFYSWVCETCGAKFSRKVTMYTHSTLTHGK